MANGLDLYTYLPPKFFFQKLSLKLNHYFLKTCHTTQGNIIFGPKTLATLILIKRVLREQINFFVKMKCMWQFNIVKKEGFERSAAQIGRIIKTFSTQLVGENQEKSETRFIQSSPQRRQISCSKWSYDRDDGFKQDITPKIYPLELYPGPTIPPARPSDFVEGQRYLAFAFPTKW